jgi:membrane-bound metal-dependent hydrolase YbcI (DUF457 family)
MPITPFHGGLGLLCKPALGRRFSFTIFVATQVVIDLESGYFLLTRQYPVHRFLHTFVGASLACLFVAVVLRRPCQALLRAVPDDVWPRWLERSVEISGPTALRSAFVGMLGHVVPDAIMHADARPFAPFSDGNPFLRLMDVGDLHLAFVAIGALGVGWLRLLAWYRLKPDGMAAGTARPADRAERGANDDS